MKHSGSSAKSFLKLVLQMLLDLEGIFAKVAQYPSEAVNSEQFDLEPCSPDSDGSCSCPRRESCPPPPKFDPNLSVAELRKLLITHYKASAFNRCTRQKLPLMGGEPLPIATRSDVKPVAVCLYINTDDSMIQ